MLWSTKRLSIDCTRYWREYWTLYMLSDVWSSVYQLLNKRKITMMMMMNSGGATSGHARSNDLAGRSTALAPPCLLLCFASVIVWNENKNFYHIWPLYLFWQWNNLSGVGGLRVLRATSSELQLDVRHLNRWRRHLVNAYEVKAGIVFTAGRTVWSMPERALKWFICHARRYTSAQLFLTCKKNK